MKFQEIKLKLVAMDLDVPTMYIKRWIDLNIDFQEMSILAKMLLDLPMSKRSGRSIEMCKIRYGLAKGEAVMLEQNTKNSSGLKKSYDSKRAGGIKTVTSRCTEFWTAKGYTEAEAKSKISDISRASGVKAFQTRVKNGNHLNTFTSQLSYWTAKGYTEDEAQKLLSERQATFTLDKCIARHGEDKGVEVFNARQEKWLKTLEDKPLDEKRHINWLKTRQHKASKESIEFFDAVKHRLNHSGELMYGAEEFHLFDGANIKYYDFTDIKNKIIIEYHGTSWHPKPGDINWVGANKLDYDTMMEYDTYKRQLAEAQGYTVLEIYSDYSSSELDKLIEKFNEKVNC